MFRLLKWATVTLAVLFAVAQFIRPARTNPAIDESRTLQAQAHLTPPVAAIFERSCNDCHSNKTTWPWYSNVVPISWYLTDHVNEGRRELNFSDWARYPPHRADIKLDNICQEVKNGSMPIRSYALLHPRAKLSPDDVKPICDWTRSEQQRLAQQESK